jgi:hypothetical protein
VQTTSSKRGGLAREKQQAVARPQGLGETALHYARNDRPIGPAWNPTENGGCACPRGLDCPDPAKHPIGFLVPQGLRDATTDPDQIREWWEQYPEANIGMPTGALSGVVVLDVNLEIGGFESLLALVRRHGALPWTRIAHTEGGLLQLYFEHPGGPLAEMPTWLRTSRPATTSRIRLQERSGRTTDQWRAKLQEGEECPAAQVARRNR